MLVIRMVGRELTRLMAGRDNLLMSRLRWVVESSSGYRVGCKTPKLVVAASALRCRVCGHRGVRAGDGPKEY